MSRNETDTDGDDKREPTEGGGMSEPTEADMNLAAKILNMSCGDCPFLDDVEACQESAGACLKAAAIKLSAQRTRRDHEKDGLIVDLHAEVKRQTERAEEQAAVIELCRAALDWVKYRFDEGELSHTRITEAIWAIDRVMKEKK